MLGRKPTRRTRSEHTQGNWEREGEERRGKERERERGSEGRKRGREREGRERQRDKRTATTNFRGHLCVSKMH